MLYLKMTDLRQVLIEEVAKMDLRKKYQLKTSYSKGDMEEEYSLNKQEYLNNKLDAPYKDCRA